MNEETAERPILRRVGPPPPPPTVTTLPPPAPAELPSRKITLASVLAARPANYPQLREMAFWTENRIGTFPGANGQPWMAFSGRIEDLMVLEGLPGAVYSSAMKCLAMPFTREIVQAVEVLVRIDIATDEYKRVRHTIFSAEAFRPKYPKVTRNPFTHEMNPEPFEHQVDCLAVAEYVHLVKKIMGFANLGEMGCVSGDAMVQVVHCGNGDPLTLRQAYQQWSRNKRDFYVRSLKGEQFGQNKVKEIINKGIRTVVEITFASGRKLKVTPDHEICVGPETWKEAGSLKSHEKVVTLGLPKKPIKIECKNCGRQQYICKDVNSPQFGECRLCFAKLYNRSPERISHPLGLRRGMDKDGYIRISRIDDPRAQSRNQYMYEHILVAEEMIGRQVQPNEEVHHRNRIRHDNRPDNLAVLSKTDHAVEHDVRIHFEDNVKTFIFPEYDEVISVVNAGEEEVYDIVMEDPHRNFVANGIVVHNCGKTRSSIDYIRFFGGIHVLILCKKIAMGQWEEALLNTGFPAACVHKLTGPLEKRRDWLLDPSTPKKPDRAKPIYVLLNWDAIARLEDALTRHNWDICIADELHIIANRNSNVSKAARNLAKKCKLRAGLTGTLIGSNNIGQVWSQYGFLDDSIFGRSYHRFIEEYAIVGGWTGRDPVALIPDRIPDLVTKLWSIGHRVTKATAFDMPPKLYRKVSLSASEKQQKAYKSLSDELFAKQTYEGEDGRKFIASVDVTNALTKSLRLMQVTAGILPLTTIREAEEGDEETVERDLRNAEEKLPSVEELTRLDGHVELGGAKTVWTTDYVQEAIDADPETKIIVWTRFRQELAHVLAQLRKALGDEAVDYIDGSVGEQRREVIRRSFNDRSSKLKVLIAQIQAVAFSIDLPAADILIFHSSTFNYREREQAEARGHRAGRTRPYQIIDLVLRNTIDNHVLRSHIAKRDFSRMLLDAGSFNRNVELEDEIYNGISDKSKEIESMELFE